MTDANFWGVNGEIFTGINSNNLIVAVRDFDGSDFSDSNPLVVKIGNTPRLVDIPMNVTINAGTNFFNAGAANFANLEIDYFVYLGWRASDSSVFLAVSRIPHARVFGDFSGTTTSDRYAAFKGTTPVSTDPVVNIGRFNAVNSGSASYNWSIPATSIIVNHPIYHTRLLEYAPTVGGAITLGNGTAKGRYQVTPHRVRWWAGFTFGNSSSMGTGSAQFSNPFTLAVTTSGVNFGIGIATVLDASSQRYPAFCEIANTSAVVYNMTVSSSQVVRSNFSSSAPMSWTTSDCVYVEADQYLP